MTDDYFTEIVKEICLLYEISLAIGCSLDVRHNSEIFLKTLMARKRLTFGAVWVRDRCLGDSAGGDGLSLAYAHPDYYVSEKRISSSHPVCARLLEEPCFACTSDDEAFEPFVSEKLLPEGAMAVFSLGDIGILKLYSASGKKQFERKELNQLRNIVAKFTTSLEGCFAHESSLREIAERRNAERLLEDARARLEERVAERTAELEASRLRLSSILNTIGEGIVVCSLGGRILSVNQAFRALYGDGGQATEGANLLDLFPSTTRQALSARLDGLKQDDIIHLEAETFRCDGSLFPVEVTISTMKIAQEPSPWGVVVLKDITERRTMEEELRKSQKLESLGILAGGIAHDFNNLLTGIMGNVSLLKHRTTPDDRNYARLDAIEKAADRAKDLTQQLLTFSRGGSPVKKTTSIEQVVMDSVSLSMRGSKSRCEFIMSAPVWPVNVDEGQMNQVFNNLIINADQAMPAGGVISIHFENSVVSQKDKSALPEGNYVKITLRDQGVGIPEEILQKIFDPYFTTKPRGNGLGLAIVYSIINKHGGVIRVESDVGTGTTFHVYLPAADQEPPVAVSKERQALPGRGRVLVMDDEEILREVSCEILTHLGYQAATCADGSEAVALYRRAMELGAPFDAVILDLIVPGGMGGKETIAKLLEIDSDVSCIVSSGYCNDPILAHYREYGFCGVVVKPYNIDKLGKAISQAVKSQA